MHARLPLLALSLAMACGDKDDTSTPVDDSGSTGSTEDPATVELAGSCPMETDQ